VCARVCEIERRGESEREGMRGRGRRREIEEGTKREGGRKRKFRDTERERDSAGHGLKQQLMV
jgi:hypothetical protein